MSAIEYYWVIAYLIIVGIAGIIYWYWHRKTDAKFLMALYNQLSKQHRNRQPLQVPNVPLRYIPLYVQLQQLLNHLPPPSGRDKLTGLINRVGLKAKLTRLMPVTQGMFVMFDLYRFRYVNDLLGFDFGDKLLVAMAQRLQGHVGEKEILARMNEDEFLIYFKQSLNETQLMALQQQLQQPIQINDTSIKLQVQLGYMDLAKHHSDVSQMLRRLDLALIRAKSSANLIASYVEGDDKSQHRQLTIISCFPRAIAQQELYLVYQPKYNVVGGGCTHVEALIRWNSAELGPISPGEFIPLLECAGMISILSHWVIEQVCLQQKHWRDSGIAMQVAVNLAIDDLSNSRLCEHLLSNLISSGLSPEVLAIEVTESQLMTDMSRTTEILSDLKRAGINVAIDDFGTGHSSLAYLKQLPIDEVKIDRAFLDNIETDARGQQLLNSAVGLAKGLGFTVTVEGVETTPVFKLLNTMNVDKIQGDLFAKPMTAAELEMNWRKLNQKISL